MRDLRTRLSNAGYGLVMNLLFNRRLSPAAMRRNFHLFAATPRDRLRRRFPRASFRELDLGGLRVESIRATEDPDRIVLYLHGGGYVFGSIETYRRRALKLSYRCRAEVVMPEYRLAPEHPFPAALADAHSAWRHLIHRGEQRPIVLAGDSAGGGLALSLLALLRDEADRLPTGAVLISPWTDLALTGASVEANRRNDCWLKRDQLLEWAAMYAADEPANHPLISPLYSDLRGLPPLLVLAGDQEIILDDARRLAARAQSAGVVVRTLIGVGMQHDWPLTLPWLAESARAWKVIDEFVATVAPSLPTKVGGPRPSS